MYQNDKSIAKSVRAAEKHELNGKHRRIKATRKREIANASN
jgi:hypothetical protein